MAKLYFRYACMGAGKSIDLLKVAFNYEERGLKVMLLTAEIDDRYEKGKITTRMGISKDAYTFSDEVNLYKLCKSLDYVPACVLIDEAQFLNKEHVNQLTDIVDYLDIPVICYGLKSDFRNELFDGSKALLTMADKIEELKTICQCGKKATCNMRILNGKIITSGNQILIGDLEYKSVCRKCYKKRVKDDGKK
jgi:thymidine kinase